MATRGTRRAAERTLELHEDPRALPRVLLGTEKRAVTVKTVVKADCKTSGNRENRAICLKKSIRKFLLLRQMARFSRLSRVLQLVFTTVFTVFTVFA